MVRQRGNWPSLCRIARLAALAMLLAGPVGAQAPASDAGQQWQTLNAQVMEAYQAGDYGKGLTLAEQAYQLARQAFGPRHPDTLTSLNNLAALYDAQGRLGEAEPLYQQALQGRQETLGPRHPDTLQSLNNLAALYYAQGRYGEAEPLFQQALQGRQETLGPRHPDTLQSLNNLAVLYQAQGRLGEAEPLHQQALQGYRETLGPRHPQTLSSLNNLAFLYQEQGRYGEAEPLYQQALQGRQETLGPRHPDTLISLNSLAFLYQAQGRYGEAEPLHQQALQGSQETLGPRHPDTLINLNNLAALYHAQGRLGEAEPLYQQALQGRQETLGPRHPDTLTSLNNLAALYYAQGRYGEAEPLYQQALQGRQETLGPRHPDTLGSLNNLAFLYLAQGRLGEAEPLYQQALQGCQETLGPRHPQTLSSLNNLAFFYQAQGRLGEAEPLYQQALQARQETLGPRHPDTLTTQGNMVVLLVNQGKRPEAVRTLQAMEANLLGWIGQELYSTAGGAVRRQLVSSQASFQDVVLTLATREASPEARRLAGTVMLRWKGLQSEEEAYLARLTRRSPDPRVRTLATEVAELRSALEAATRSDKPDAFDTALRALEAKQLALGQVSRDYKDHLRVRSANLDDLRAALPPGTVLIEFRQFRPFDFRTGERGEPRLAALLLAGFDEPEVADLGPLAPLRASVAALLPQAPSGQADAAATALYQQLFAPFESRLATAGTVYLAPDGPLHLIPFARLKLADGRYWEERQQVRRLETGRDLLRADPDRPARGLLALGGIDFGAAAATAAGPDSVFLAAAGGQGLAAALNRTAETIGGFSPLPATAEEATQVKDRYRRYRKDEPAEAWLGADAGEARLLALTSPPRVLHLATHGFYLPGEAPEPMLLAGIALAGANRAKATGDGILFALEAQGLNLDGSELVVLSACDTARGTLDYAEGVYGLVRALRTAGSRNVLVTLWPVNDGEARDFMLAFYRTWLAQAGRSDPARALHDTRLAYINHDTPALRQPAVWAPYVLVE